MHTLGVPPGPHRTPAQASQWPREKKRKRPSPLEPDSPPAPKPGRKHQRQSFLPCLRRGSLPEAQPSFGTTTPKGERASSPCHSPRFCPATVIKSRVPLGPSAMQNCSTPLALPTQDLNATFDLSEEPPSKLGFHECVGWENVPQELNRLDQPFIPRWVSLPASLPARGQESARQRCWPALAVSFPLVSSVVLPRPQRAEYTVPMEAVLLSAALPCLSKLQGHQLRAALWHAHE